MNNDENTSWDKLIDDNHGLSPRHRKLAELAAQGLRNTEIAEQLNYSEGRISTLLSSPRIQAEIRRIQDAVFAESVGKRLKQLGTEAMDAIEACIRDTSRANASRRLSAATWVAEQVNGRATQRHEVNSDISLSAFIDRLDALRALGQGQSSQSSTAENVTVEGPKPQLQAPEEEDALDAWIRDFDSSPS